MSKDILIIGGMILYLTAFGFGIMYCVFLFLQFLYNYGG
jgi:hypothetical protein